MGNFVTDFVDSITGKAGADAASDAADAGAAGARYQADIQKQMFDEQMRLQEPFRQGGMVAQNRMLTYLGIVPEYAYDEASPKSMFRIGTESPVTPTPQFEDNWAGRLKRKVFEEMQANKPAPAREAYAVPKSQFTNDPSFGKYARDFSMSDFEEDPGYAFRISEGLKALDRQAMARGGLASGGALKATVKYGQDMASQEYTNAFNRYQINRQNQLAPLQSLMGAGQTAATTMTNAAGDNAEQLGSAAMNEANARASGYIGAADAKTNSLLNKAVMTAATMYGMKKAGIY